jgi:hypothetical protein
MKEPVDPLSEELGANLPLRYNTRQRIKEVMLEVEMISPKA